MCCYLLGTVIGAVVNGCASCADGVGDGDGAAEKEELDILQNNLITRKV